MGAVRDRAIRGRNMMIRRRLSMCRSLERGRTLASAHRRRFVNIAPNTTAKNTNPSTSRIDISFVCSFLNESSVERARIREGRG